jgi:hypothetical protein
MLPLVNASKVLTVRCSSGIRVRIRADGSPRLRKADEFAGVSDLRGMRNYLCQKEIFSAAGAKSSLGPLPRAPIQTHQL